MKPGIICYFCGNETSHLDPRKYAIGIIIGKQQNYTYIYVYFHGTLMHIAQYGNTEITPMRNINDM